MGPLFPYQRPPPSPAMTSHSPSSTTVPRKRSHIPNKEEALNPSFANLPSSLLEAIMSDLELKDNIRASAACKSWHEAAVYVRVVEKHPWLLCFPKNNGKLFELYDPLKWKSYSLNLPELADSCVCHSKDGWLLMRRSFTQELFFFNPFTRDLLSLPKFQLPFKEFAFSCPPTSDHCVVITFNFDERAQERRIIISTCHPQATEWITDDFPSSLPVYKETQIVYVNDRFYFFNNGNGSLNSFHPSSRTWKSHPLAHIYRSWYEQCNGNPKPAFLAEKNGDLFLMLTSGNERPVVRKLVSPKWEEMSQSDLDGLTFFVSFYNSELRTDLPSMRNKAYFSRSGYNRKHPVSYSFDKSRYHPRNAWHNWLDLCPRRSLWINPPENVLNYL